ncbi:MAG TPA: hypothetical protein VL285_22960 [Bryobacteraceae bacterium]|jgi:hypothetical protein|nr:hypothetical protein [Bryobacteraceae bacterium]
MKWTFFAGSAALAGYLLLASGAPPAAVAAGIIGAALWTLLQRRKSHS